MSRFISLGNTCDVAYQIRRYTKSEDAYLFDWLGTPFHAIESLFWSNDKFFINQKWAVENDIKIRDDISGLKTMHSFPTLEDQYDGKGRALVDSAKVDQHWNEVRDKLLYLKNKTLDTIRTEKNLFLVRKEHQLTRYQITKKLEQLQRWFQPLNPQVKIILTSASMPTETYAHHSIALRVKEGNGWKGDDASWNRLFKQATKQWG